MRGSGSWRIIWNCLRSRPKVSLGEKEGRAEGIRVGVVAARAFGRRIQYNQVRGGRMAVRAVHSRRVRSLRGARGLPWRVLNLNEVKQGASCGR